MLRDLVVNDVIDRVKGMPGWSPELARKLETRWRELLAKAPQFIGYGADMAVSSNVSVVNENDRLAISPAGFPAERWPGPDADSILASGPCFFGLDASMANAYAQGRWSELEENGPLQFKAATLLPDEPPAPPSLESAADLDILDTKHIDETVVDESDGGHSDSDSDYGEEEQRRRKRTRSARAKETSAENKRLMAALEEDASVLETLRPLQVAAQIDHLHANHVSGWVKRLRTSTNAQGDAVWRLDMQAVFSRTNNTEVFLPSCSCELTMSAKANDDDDNDDDNDKEGTHGGL
ncbi:Hypothetical Protein FCC1311_077722 [Hondaea fermentalgiana]|uniref:Uncharacterized protein n=1 Tax=Hondaea fermentalgiana TaxID=2315210 RepID=A0A2R5GP45_9STRA|nr:Hypothetical Protein FCC1311_077722 [Hondaea fermentalgiana]|eukprot:GBG31548.1 Hypothetical Protein FCC1311_077722 [Hondaea fermentalgiana]